MAPTCSCTTCGIGAAQRLGLDYATLVDAQPAAGLRLRRGLSQGQRARGRSGVRRPDPGAVSGLASLNAGPDGAPRYFPTVLVDKLTGPHAGAR